MSSTKRLGLEYLEVNQSQKEVTVNEALNKLDFFVGLTVEKYIDAPPSGPQEGAAFLVGENASGAWQGKSNQIAHYLNGAWEFYTPFKGLRLFAAETGEEYLFVDSWHKISVPSIEVVDTLPAEMVAGIIYMVKEA